MWFPESVAGIPELVAGMTFSARVSVLVLTILFIYVTLRLHRDTGLPQKEV